MLEEDSRCRAMGIQPLGTTLSANRAQDTKKGNDEAKPSAPKPAPRGPPPDYFTYPPEGGVKWSRLKEIVEDKTSCPYCHSRGEFHWKVGCPALVALGLVVKTDTTATEAILTKFTDHKGPRSPYKGKPKKVEAPSGCRAQSGECSPKVDPPPFTAT